MYNAVYTPRSQAHNSYTQTSNDIRHALARNSNSISKVIDCRLVDNLEVFAVVEAFGNYAAF
jgi:hypothetical protein